MLTLEMQSDTIFFKGGNRKQHKSSLTSDEIRHLIRLHALFGHKTQDETHAVIYKDFYADSVLLYLKAVVITYKCSLCADLKLYYIKTF